jgi:hypothetical protein
MKRTNKTPISHLIKFDVHSVVKNDGETKYLDVGKLTLMPVGKYLKLFFTDQPTQLSWLISEKPIVGRLQRGGYIPWDKAAQYYVHSHEKPHKRFKFLYVNGTQIGTMDEINLYWDVWHMTARKRASLRQAKEIGRIRWKNHERKSHNVLKVFIPGR